MGNYPPPYGGIANHLYTLLPDLIKEKYLVTTETISTKNKKIESPFMLNSYFNLKNYILKNTFTIIINYLKYLKYKRDLPLKEFIKTIVLSSYLSNQINTKKYDTIFIYSIASGYCIPILKSIFPLKSFNLMIFGDFYKNPNFFKAQKKYLLSVFDSCKNIMASSAYCGNSVKYLLDKKYPVKVVYIGVDSKLFKPCDENQNFKPDAELPKNAIVLLFFARMIKIMGLDFVLENYQEILNINPNVYLVIAGAKGALSSEVERISKLNKRVIYRPDVSFENKINYFQQTDILLAPTLENQACMGVAIKEAMACGLPIIASNSGGIPEAINDGEEGFTVSTIKGSIDKTMFIKRIKTLCDNTGLRNGMGKKGREKVLSLFTNESTVEKYINILENDI